MLLHWIWFAEMKDISLLHKHRLLERFGDPEELFRMSEEALLQTGLPEKERNIFIRRYFFFESMKKIGERYGFSENRVSVILFRTRKKLRKYLEKEGFFNGKNGYNLCNRKN